MKKKKIMSTSIDSVVVGFFDPLALLGSSPLGCGAGATLGVFPFRASAIVLNALNILSIVNIFFLRRLCFLTKMMS
jgi:hypothetical protein